MFSQQQLCALAFDEQLVLVWAEGTYIARWYKETDTIGLYHMDSFFCEVYYDQFAESIVLT